MISPEPSSWLLVLLRCVFVEWFCCILGLLHVFASYFNDENHYSVLMAIASLTPLLSWLKGVSAPDIPKQPFNHSLSQRLRRRKLFVDSMGIDVWVTAPWTFSLTQNHGPRQTIYKVQRQAHPAEEHLREIWGRSSLQVRFAGVSRGLNKTWIG